MKKTKLYPVHEKLNAKIVEFAGYLMPVHYSSIIAEHKAVRNSVGVFDVSHMGEIFIKGNNALELVQYITVNDALKLFPGRVQYSAMCYENGGIVDDLLVYKISDDEFMLVVNASNIEKDYEWIKRNNKFNAVIENRSDEFSLIAVQGPNSKKVVEEISGGPVEFEYYHFGHRSICGIEMIVSRTGYTGELGYELYFRGDEKTAEKIWNAVFDAGRKYNLLPVGLAARDSLRLEMGFCLYGNDIDQTTNPLEAGLEWITKLNKKDFIGKDSLLKFKTNGFKRKLVGMKTEEKAFPRHGYDLTHSGKKIGTITSGTVSPILGKPIALGYVQQEYSAPGSKVNFNIRGKDIPAEVVKIPFVSRN
ncbi:MAG: glycine cleavage system aminomethyltransferase GcvT [Ignavibacteria bacterium]